MFVGRIGKGATPLCKQLTLAAVEGWVPGNVPMFPWHVAFKLGRESAGQTEEALLGVAQEPSDSICHFLHGREEGDGKSQRQVDPPPTSWHCDQHLPTASATFHFSSSSLFRQLTAFIPLLSMQVLGGFRVRPTKS